MSYTNISILIVEDDKVYSKTLRTWLKSLSISNITSVSSAEEGSKVLNEHKPDIIFLDNNLPNKKGIDVIHHFKALSEHSFLIFISSAFELDELATAIQKRADYLFDKKKTSKSEVLNIVKSVIKTIEEKSNFWNNFQLFNNVKPANDTLEKNIAIVEDNEMFSFYLSWILGQTRNNHTVNTFEDAGSFYIYCKDTAPDIIFLDYYLPDSNGKEVLKFIKAHYPDAIVIVISSLINLSTVMELKSLGIDNYLVKNDNLKKNVATLIQQMKL